MDVNRSIDNSCKSEKAFCINCNSQFRIVRPTLIGIVLSRHFVRDLKDPEKRNSIIRDILDCSNLDFNELHKFEVKIDGNLIFRARKGRLHIVYGIDKKRRIVFLRAISNFTEYKKLLTNKSELKKMIEH